jgi:hypothetical protein
MFYHCSGVTIVLHLLLCVYVQVHRMWCAFVAAFAMMSLLLWCNLTPSLAKVRFSAAAAAAAAAAGPTIQGGRSP